MGHLNYRPNSIDFTQLIFLWLPLDGPYTQLTTHTKKTRKNYINHQVCTIAATSLFKILLKYRPEDKAAEKKAQSEAEGKHVESKMPIVGK